MFLCLDIEYYYGRVERGLLRPEIAGDKDY